MSALAPKKPRQGVKAPIHEKSPRASFASARRVRENRRLKLRRASGKGLPGQYFDQETGLHYNYFRDYDPGTGRYVQSDPIGLAGGLSTYSYGYSNPVTNSDPIGLWTKRWHIQFTEEAMAVTNNATRLPDGFPETVAAVDNEFGSQFKESASQHSQCPEGISPEACRSMYAGMVKYLLRKCDYQSLARAIHAVQDSFSPAHQSTESGVPSPSTYRGPLSRALPLLNNVPSVGPMHGLQDAFPSPSIMPAVRAVTVQLIDAFYLNCQCQ